MKGLFFPQKQASNGIYPQVSQTRSTSGLSQGHTKHPKKTYGRSLIKPTVGRLTDLLWVTSTTYRGSFFIPWGAPSPWGG